MSKALGLVARPPRTGSAPTKQHDRARRSASGAARVNGPRAYGPSTVRTAVEEITGRRVIAFMSQVHVDPDIPGEIFVLEPAEQDRDLAAEDEADIPA